MRDGKLAGTSEIEVFTTRPDTLWGVTFFVFAVEHPAVGGVGHALLDALPRMREAYCGPIDADGKVAYTELVPEITTEPDYDAAVAALS